MKKYLIKNILFTILTLLIIADLVVIPIEWLTTFRNIQDFDVQQLIGSYLLSEGILTIFMTNKTFEMWNKYIAKRKENQNQ